MEYVVETDGIEVCFDVADVLAFDVEPDGDVVVHEKTHPTRIVAGAWSRWYLRETQP